MHIKQSIPLLNLVNNKIKKNMEIKNRIGSLEICLLDSQYICPQKVH